MAQQKANVKVGICRGINSAIYREKNNLKMIFKKFYSKENKKENSTVLQKTNVKVEIGKGNNQCDL